MEKFYTPLRTPTAKGRRKALSPATKVPLQVDSSFTSPYAIVELGMNEQELRIHILEQDSTIRELRSTIKKMEETMSSKMNESILIETSNRINEHESRMFQKDIALYENEVKDLTEKLRTARLDLSAEVNKRITVEDNLRRREIAIEDLEHRLKSANSEANRLQEKLVDKDQTITQLRAEVSSAKYERSTLEVKLGKCQEDVEEARSRNRTLSVEISTLKTALTECKEELRRSLEDVKDTKENMTKKEIELRRSLESNFVSQNISTSHNLLTAFQSLSSQITTIQKTHLSVEQVADIQHKIGELSATNKFLEGKVMEYEEREELLTKQLFEAQGNAETAKSELAELQKKLVEIEGSSTLTHKYLLEEANKIKQQKAALRCELIELRRDFNKQKEKLEKLEANQADQEKMSDLRSELDSSRKREQELESENASLKQELEVLQQRVKELEDALDSARQQIGETTVEQRINRELREELKKAEAKLIELTSTMEIVDTQCEQFRELRKRAETMRQKALDECAEVTNRLREAERELERQRAADVELKHLVSEKERLEMKIRYLNDELRETHNDYRSELAQLARQISETKHQDVTDNEEYVMKIDELKTQLAQMDNSSRSVKRQLDELKQDNQKLQEQVSASVARELEVTNENKKLRSGLTDAVGKIEQYKHEAERSKEVCEEMAEQLGVSEERISKLEEEVINLEDMLREKEKLEAYLQSQVKAKDMPKLSRRSTLLRTPSETSLEVVDPVVVEELENEKSNLLKELEEKKKELMSRKMMPPPVPKGSRVQPTAAYTDTITRHPMTGLQWKSVADIRYTCHQKKASTLAAGTPQKAIMRHDIPHRWTELRHFGLFSIKCAVCFIGVPTLAKKKRCAHCGIIVHSQCSKRVVNTCGLPDLCANYYLDSHIAPSGRMNGWVRLFRDDCSVREWQSAWGEMDEKRLTFYDNDSVQNDLRKPFLTVDLEKELRIVRVGSEVPVKTDSGQVSHNIVHLKTESRNIYILAPSMQTAKRWAEALQNASTRRMMLTRRPSSFSEQSCILVLSKPNNLTIHTTCIIDDYLLIGAQSGLFFTQLSSARVPVRIGGFNSVTAMECLSDLNILALVIDQRRSLALLPLPALKLALNASQPSIRADVLAGFDYLHALAYHQQDGQRYLCAATSAKIHVLKYNAARDVFTGHQVIETREPAMCMQSTASGFFFGSDSFYCVHFSRAQMEPIRLAESNIADYPIALLPIRDDEVLLAYQNYGLFVNLRGERTRNHVVEWEHMPMEFVFTAPYLYVVHYDSIEILQVADYTGPDSRTILDEREVFECKNAHVVCCRPNGDVLISISNTDSVELHRFNATNSKRSAVKRKGLTATTFDKRSKVAA